MANSPIVNDQPLPYDLRQIYANLVGEHLVLVAEARIKQDFYTWYKSLENLKTITKHKFKDEKFKELYDEKVKKVISLANEYITTWKGEFKDQNGIRLIDEALRDLEEFLYKQMERSKIFGEGYRIPSF